MDVLKFAFLLLCIAQVQSIILPIGDIVSKIAGELMGTQLKGLAEMTSGLITNCFKDVTYKSSAKIMTETFFSKVQLTDIAAFSKNNKDASKTLAEELMKAFDSSSKSLPIANELNEMIKCVKFTSLIEYYFSVLLTPSTKTEIINQINKCAAEATGNKQNTEKAKELITQGINCIDDANDALAKEYSLITKPSILSVLLDPLKVISDLIKDLADNTLKELGKISVGSTKDCFTDVAYENVYSKMHIPFFKTVKRDGINSFKLGDMSYAKKVADAIEGDFRKIFSELPFGTEANEIVDCVGGFRVLVEFYISNILSLTPPNLVEKFRKCASDSKGNKENVAKAAEMLSQELNCLAKNRNELTAAFLKITSK